MSLTTGSVETTRTKNIGGIVSFDLIFRRHLPNNAQVNLHLARALIGVDGGIMVALNVFHHLKNIICSCDIPEEDMNPPTGVLKRKIKTKEQRQAELEAQIRKKQVFHLYQKTKFGSISSIFIDCPSHSIVIIKMKVLN